MLELLREHFGFAILLNLILLPFYVTKFHRRFLATWHLIPLLGAQWVLLGVLPVVQTTARDRAILIFMAPIGLAAVTVIAFFYASLARRDPVVLRIQNLNAKLPLGKTLSVLFLRYFSIPALFWSVPAFIGSGLAPPPFMRNSGVMLVISLILYRVSSHHLKRLRAGVQ